MEKRNVICKNDLKREEAITGNVKAVEKIKDIKSISASSQHLPNVGVTRIFRLKPTKKKCNVNYEVQKRCKYIWTSLQVS